jgi:PRC-barrel domain
MKLLEANMGATTETTSLISAGKVTGSAVYNTAGESVGKIYDVMIDKLSGKVAYAVMSFGGFLGMGDSYHPLPWSLLRYDSGIGGYVVNISKQKLEGGPNYVAGSNPAWGDRAYDEKVYGYYGSPPFWGAM